ncbi:hypothetical protein KP509_1Z044700 [Ceratopteris richardii]|nr:hypothetical protein KP509_1Z044700 [Ceratopteris richardii]KAH6558805.1 hypothetical protein KP509_1Z044700 [Ceratopteris richardii]
MNNEPIRFGILGCANIARKMSASILATPGASLRAIGSRSLEKAQSFAREAGLPVDVKVYGSYEGVLSDEKVDVVYIPLPTSLHLEWAVKAAEKKKHILIEKPPALAAEELNTIISACENMGVQFMDCTMWMHHPRTAKVKEILKSKELFGDLQEVHAIFCVPMQAKSPGFFVENIRVSPQLDALGALGDLGWYSIRGILWANDYDLPASVTALPGTKFTTDGVITSCGASFTWKDGRVATFSCSFHADKNVRLVLYGNNGTLEMPGIDAEEFKLYGVSIFQDMDIGWSPDVTEFHIKTDVPQENLMVQRFSSLVKGIRDGSGVIDTHWAVIARKTQQLLDAVKLSIEHGCSTMCIEA